LLNIRFATNTFETAEHVGTHMDAPFHFGEDGWKVGDIPLERLFVPGELRVSSDKIINV